MAGGFGVTILSAGHRRSSAAPPAASRNSRAHGRSPGSRRIAGAAFPDFHQVQWREKRRHAAHSRGGGHGSARGLPCSLFTLWQDRGTVRDSCSSFAEGCQIFGTSRTLPGDETRALAAKPPSDARQRRGRSISSTAAAPRRFWPSSKDRLIKGLNFFERSGRALLCALQAPQFDILGMRRADFRARLLCPDNSGVPGRRFRAANGRASGAPLSFARAASNPAFANYSNYPIAVWPRKARLCGKFPIF